ncbi:MAG: TonB-dependent receptor plug domain-containing protein [Bacteroidales bacterium]|nr:TonB-dependent receptor plug domain-containing protein [Bacteroidales bacterium]
MSKRILLSAAMLFCGILTVFAQVSDTLGFSTASASNVAELLRGKVSGVRVSQIDGNPAGLMNVNIRGINTLRTNNQPLWIVDGAIVSYDLNDNIDAFWQYGESNYTAPLNPLSFLAASEIESIEVLKDASATALYGSRGANGVIIIKTKKSSLAEKRFSFDANAGVNTYPKSISNGYVSVLHNYRAALDGNIDKTSYNFSATFRHDGGSMPRMGSNYGSVKANFNTQANRAIWLGFNALLSAGQSSSTTGTAYFGSPSYNLAVRDESLASGTTPELWKNNYDDDSKDYRALASSQLIFNITQGLRAKALVGIDFQDNTRYIWYGDGLPLGSKSEDNVQGGAAAILSSVMFNYNGRAELEFNRFFNEVHHFKASAGWEMLGYINKFNTMNKLDFATYELRAKGLNLGNSAVNNRNFQRSYNHHAVFAHAEYSFRDFVGADASYRFDWTPKYKGNIMDHYPAVNAWVDLHNILFRDFKSVSYLKVKGGFGISGNEKYVPYELFSNYLSSGWPTPESGTEAFYDGMDRIRTKELNVGLNVGFLSDRYFIGVTYYDRSTLDSFEMFCNGAKYPEADYWGWKDPSFVFSRVSEISNRGFEFDFRGVLINNNSFKWTVDANVSYNVNAVVSSNADDFPGKNVGHNLYCTCNTVGLPVSSFFGYKTDADGNICDITGNGIISYSDKIVLGNSIPKCYGGLQTVLSFGQFSVELQMDGAAGFGIANVNSLIKDGFFDADGQMALSEKYIEKGDYLRLSQLGVKYNLPCSNIKWLKGLDIRLSMNNIYTFTSYSGWNPDVNCFGVSTLANGYDYGSFPSARSVILGISLKF